MFGKDVGDVDYLKSGSDLWSKGTSEGWYYKSKSNGLTWRKWWARSLTAHIGLELFLYLVIYYIIHLIYFFGFDKDYRRENFDPVIRYFDKNLSGMGKEMTFLLGFYVSNIVKRWWDQYKQLPWPDTLVAISHALVDFKTEKSMDFCQTILRYCMLSYILCIRRLSKALRKMFPDDKSLIDAKVATKKEIKIMENQGDLGRVWWIPLSWCMTMIKGSKENKFVPSEQKILIDQLAKYQVKLEHVDTFDHIIMPPLYKQVVRFAVWVYFLLSLIGSQPQPQEPYTFIPIFLILKFIFFFGWLEVAEAIENPFGNDEDDFHICQLVSRHLWAIGRNISLYQGPPGMSDEETSEEDDEDGETDGDMMVNVKINIDKSE